jgi:tRNA uridine 5-carbamoylmethylation protein Kti12
MSTDTKTTSSRNTPTSSNNVNGGNENSNVDDAAYHRAVMRHQIIRAIMIFVVFIILHQLFQSYVLDRYFGRPQQNDDDIRRQIASQMCPPGGECEWDPSQLEQIKF